MTRRARDDEGFPDLRYLHGSMRAVSCAECRTDFAYPVYWDFIDFGAVMVWTSCSNCHSSYSLVMSLAQASQWDAEMTAHVSNIGHSATLLGQSIEAQKRLPQWRDL